MKHLPKVGHFVKTLISTPHPLRYQLFKLFLKIILVILICTMGSADSKIQGVQLNLFRGQSSECCPPHMKKMSWFNLLCHNLFIYKFVCIDNDNIWCEQLGKVFRHSLSHKIQGVDDILIGPVGQFQSV